MRVGKVQEIWRYPVKSLAGGTVPSATLEAQGMAGDRGWALVDADTGDLCSAKTVPGLLDLTASYSAPHGAERRFGDAVPAVEVGFPDGRVARGREAVSAAVSDFLGRPVRLHPLEDADQLAHYRWSEPLDEEKIARILNIQPGEEGPDLAAYDPGIIAMLAEYASPPGTYHDMFPLHLLTSASLQHMNQVAGGSFDRRRFRPSLYIETVPELTGLVEFDWVGASLRVGATRLQVQAKTIRCAMPARGQAPYQLQRDPAVAKSLYHTTNRFLGAYATVLAGGSVAAGDEVHLED